MSWQAPCPARRSGAGNRARPIFAPVPNDVDHFRRRAIEERSAASRAEAPARNAHEQVADAYERLVQQLEELARLRSRPTQPAPRTT